jgi:hypothetical protein
MFKRTRSAELEVIGYGFTFFEVDVPLRLK